MKSSFKFLSFWFLVFIVTGCSEPIKYDLVISNVHIFDGEKNLGITNIAIAGDTVATISIETLLADSVIDGTGKFVVPGLVNAHVHMWESEMLATSHDVGVLTVLDLFELSLSEENAMRQYRDSLGYSNYYGAGPGATVRNGHPHTYLPLSDDFPFISDSLSASEFVKIAVEKGAEVIKIIREPGWYEEAKLVELPTLSYQQIEEIIHEANSHGLKSLVHITKLDDALAIAALRPSGFAHFWETQGELSEEDKKLLKESGIFFIPTLKLQQNLNMQTQYDTTMSQIQREFDYQNYLVPDKLFEEKIYEIYELGIPIIAGTDPPNEGVNYGSDLIEELRIYDRAGIPLLEVLKTATGNATRHLPIDGNGSLKVGSPATMLILNGNPLENLDALEDISMIIKNGHQSVRAPR
ncbi:amidohydrolase family protein [Algoriphagus namhaensis]|uniref:Amidohydrolase family protein n=1 Tax=Algoriphagus namhaensis TaxID=915353 RepID=A0ABV8AP75_9BACT